MCANIRIVPKPQLFGHVWLDSFLIQKTTFSQGAPFQS